MRKYWGVSWYRYEYHLLVSEVVRYIVTFPDWLGRWLISPNQPALVHTEMSQQLLDGFPRSLAAIFPRSWILLRLGIPWPDLITIDPEGNMNVWATFHSNKSNVELKQLVKSFSWLIEKSNRLISEIIFPAKLLCSSWRTCCFSVLCDRKLNVFGFWTCWLDKTKI